MGVVNTVGWMQTVIFILKRVVIWRGVKVFSRFGGEEREILMKF